MKVDAAKEEKCWEGPARGAFTHLHVPFRAITLQQLANAILTSKKVSRITAAVAAAAAAVI